ncbi:glycosyltransferase family 8 protein [Mucilaginibacter sp. 14171R-50]|uniref:glycosyltransferase family 8 protein n=1 Tax=Mucilaginibacter sp. 14171R-50 TaxID=2703789 RepID=UPI00138BBA08|nr:glycosyltransferase family 8 protein [Mucilaginibacter sp. 14171R-50]QHS56258.1 glycosyltransferase family 8 protein [Mucilaginibacter sp. 14171R-50]
MVQYNTFEYPMFLNAIAITIDNNYIQHACVMLRSLDVNVQSQVDVYCIFDDLSQQNIHRMRREFNSSRVNLHFIPFDKSVLPALPIKANDHVTSATFFRIWLPHLLPNLDQVLFMDTDIIINGDISEILNLDTGSYPLAAVPDLGMSAEKKRGLGIADGQMYMNCGVLLLNLKYFRANDLTTQIANFIATYPALCEFWDQDAINATIKGNFYQLDYKYNVQSGFYEKPAQDVALRNAIQNPVVVHYTGGGSCKPWYYQNKHPERDLYYKYLKLTSFRFYYPPDLPRSWRLFRKLRFMLFYK